MNLPRMFPVRQRFQNLPLDDVTARAIRETRALLDAMPIRSGAQIAVTAGSRGITNLPTILKAVIGELKNRDTRPFLVPAMGSHGGAKADGKVRLLAAMGISEELMGAPIRSTEMVKKVGETPAGIPLFLDPEAAAADHILLVNRVHPHPSFEGPIQSGLMKMLSVGLGNRPGAEMAHRHSRWEGLGTTILSMSRTLLELLPVIGGIGIVENEKGEVALLKGIAAGKLEEEEKSLLRKSQTMRARIPFQSLHLLIIDRIGKDIAGTGMDPKVLGRPVETVGAKSPEPRIARIYARDLTEGSHGNGHGVGLADFVHRRLAEAIDWEVTRANSLSASAPERSKLPLVLDSDREAFEAAFLTCGPIGETGPRVVRIQDTRHLEELWVSESLMEETERNANLDIIEKLDALKFNPDGMLV